MVVGQKGMTQQLSPCGHEGHEQRNGYSHMKGKYPDTPFDAICHSIPERKYTGGGKERRVVAREEGCVTRLRFDGGGIDFEQRQV